MGLHGALGPYLFDNTLEPFRKSDGPKIEFGLFREVQKLGDEVIHVLDNMNNRVQALLRRIIRPDLPRDQFGCGEDGAHEIPKLMRNARGHLSQDRHTFAQFDLGLQVFDLREVRKNKGGADQPIGSILQ